MLQGRLYKNASQRESYEIFDAGEDFLPTFASVLTGQFGFRQVSEIMATFDAVYIDFRKNNVLLHLGWDNWSGCFVFAPSPAGDPHIIEIGEYMDKFLSEWNEKNQ